MLFLLSAAAALAGGLLFDRLNVPAGPLIGAMVAVGALALLGAPTTGPPPIVRMMAFMVIGWSLGADIERDLFRQLAGAAVPILLGLGVLLLAGAFAAWALWFLNAADPMTAFLAMSPGGLSQMAALSAAVGANASLVATVHLVRIITVVLLAPLVVRFLPDGP